MHIKDGAGSSDDYDDGDEDDQDDQECYTDDLTCVLLLESDVLLYFCFVFALKDVNVVIITHTHTHR